MKENRRIVWFTGIAVLAVLCAGTGRLSAGEINTGESLELTLEECIEKGITASPELAGANAEIVQKEAALDLAQRSRWPSLEISGGYTLLSEVENGEIAIPSGGSISLPSADSEAVALHFTAAQPVFSGFEIRTGIKNSEKLLGGARLNRRGTIREIRYRVEQAYWRLVNAAERVEVTGKSVERAKSLLKEVRSLFSQGMVTREDVLRMEMNREQSLLLSLEADHMLQLSMMELDLLIGNTSGKVVRPAYDFENQDMLPEEFDYQNTLASAFAQRTELQLMQIQKAVQEGEMKKISAAWWPKISLQGQIRYDNPHTRQFPPENEFVFSWQIGVMGTISLTRLKNMEPEKAAAEGAYQELAGREEELVRKISLQIKKDLLELERSRKLLESTETILAQAKENYDIVYNKFRSGSAVNSDVLSAQEKLLNAQLQRTQAFTAQRLAVSQIKYDAGYGE